MTIEILKPTMYKLRNIEGGCSYALITLTDLHENAGSISIDSDYGSWNYMWGSMGSDIRGFLLRTSKDYLINKLTMNNRADRDVFDFEKTIVEMKKAIINYRKEEYIDSELARKAYNEAKELSEEYTTSHEAFYNVSQEYESIQEVFNSDYFPCHTDYSASIKMFMNEVFPVFKDILKKEIV